MLPITNISKLFIVCRAQEKNAQSLALQVSRKIDDHAIMSQNKF